MKSSSSSSSSSYFIFIALFSFGFSFVIFQTYLLNLIPAENEIPFRNIGELINYNKMQLRHDYDLVTVIHHEDMHIFIDYGYASWLKYFVSSPNSRVFAICTPEAFEKLSKLKQDAKNSYQNLILVTQNRFPFTMHDLESTAFEDKKTWKYQQLLKLYSYQILSDQSIVNPTIKRLFLVIDSDTIAVRSFTFVDINGKPIYNIATEQSGAFITDTLVSQSLMKELFPNGEIRPAFENTHNIQYTSIAHMMMFDGEIVNKLLSHIRQEHANKDAWAVLNTLERSVISEWEIYMAWIMHHHKEEIALKQIPYVNWGNITQENLDWVREERDVYYVTAHSEWDRFNICCVNSEWSKISGADARFPCKCCPIHDCENLKINCQVLGKQPACSEVDGLMYFKDERDSIDVQNEKS